MSWQDMMQEFIGSHIKSEVYTMLPATVTSVDQFEEKQYVNVNPTVKRLWDDEFEIPLATIYNVPLVYPAGGGGILSFPVEVGDGVMVVFGMRDIDKWRKGDAVVPEEARTSRSHSLTDAIAIAGLFNETTTLKPSPVDTEWRFKESKVKQSPDGTITLTNASGDLVFQPDGTVLHPSGARITPDGDFIESNGVSLRNHTHQVIVTTGSSVGTYISEAPQ